MCDEVEEAVQQHRQHCNFRYQYLYSKNLPQNPNEDREYDATDRKVIATLSQVLLSPNPEHDDDGGANVDGAEQHHHGSHGPAPDVMQSGHGINRE